MRFAHRTDLGMWRGKTRAKKAVKCSISLRRMGLSTSLILLVGLRRPLAFGLPVPLRVQSLGYGSVQHSAFLAPRPHGVCFAEREDLIIMAATDAKTCKLRDGRTYAWREYGDLEKGYPVIFLHGVNNSRLYTPSWGKSQEQAANAGARVEGSGPGHRPGPL